MYYRALLSFLMMAAAHATFANSPAPIWIEGNFSSPMINTKAPGLVVLREDLRIHCYFSACKVEVTYQIESRNEMKVEFRFILPTAAQIEPRLNDQVLTVSKMGPIVDLENESWLNEGQKIFLSKKEQLENPLHAASFEGRVQQGRQSLMVNYVQPSSLILRRPYLFREARGRAGFAYVLAPLKEWELHEDFELKVQFSWDLPPRGFFARVFGSGYRRIECNGKKQDFKTNEKERKPDEPIVQSFEIVYKKDFPDLFMCEGDLTPELDRVYKGDYEALAEAFEKNRLL